MTVEHPSVPESEPYRPEPRNEAERAAVRLMEAVVRRWFPDLPDEWPCLSATEARLVATELLGVLRQGGLELHQAGGAAVPQALGAVTDPDALADLVVAKLDARRAAERAVDDADARRRLAEDAADPVYHVETAPGWFVPIRASAYAGAGSSPSGPAPANR